MKIVYVRGDSGVSVDGVGFFEPDKPVDVPNDLGESLLKTGLFKQVKNQVEKESRKRR